MSGLFWLKAELLFLSVYTTSTMPPTVEVKIDLLSKFSVDLGLSYY